MQKADEPKVLNRRDNLIDPGVVWTRVRQKCRELVDLFRPSGKQEEPAPLSRESLGRTAWVAVGLLLAVFPLKLLMDLIDPFGMLSASKRESETLSTRLAAPFYGSSAQDHIAVVLVDEATLDARGIAWPPRYDYYEEVLRRILEKQPRAIYVDLLVNRERIFDDSLADAKEALSQDLQDSSVPVYFGTDLPGKRTLFSDVAGVGGLVTAWQKVDYYPLTLAPNQVLGASDSASSICNPDFLSRSVAYALYQDACPRDDTNGCKESARLMTASQACRSLSIQWGQQQPVGSARAAELDPSGCVVPARSAYRKIAKARSWLMAGMLGNVFPKWFPDPREPCTYTLTLHEEQMDDPLIAAQLKDRIVLIGADLVGLNDLAGNPVNGQIPGVYVHAMALDNLMTWGRDHLAPVRRAWVASLAFSILTSILVAFVLRHARPVGLWLVAAGVLLAFGPIWVMHVWLRHPPVDWIGSLAVFAWVVFIARRVAHQSPDPLAATSTPRVMSKKDKRRRRTRIERATGEKL